MSPLDADAMVDRRRIRRKLTFWRAFAILVVIAAVCAVAAALARRGTAVLPAASPYIARVTITGLIRNDRDRSEALEKLAKSDAKAVIVEIDSPGGTTAGSEQLHNVLRRLVTSKPTVMVVNGLAASGAYIAAIAGDHIVAHETSLVGSIGVLFQFPNFTDLMKTVGVKMEEIKSSPLKAAPNGYEPTSPEARAAIESIVMDSYAWFRGLVRDRRHLDEAELARVADGRVFTGRQGIELKLVDQLGDEQAAIEWLAKEKGIDPKLRVRDWELQPRFGDLGFLHLAQSILLTWIGLGRGTGFDELAGMRAFEQVNLDGLLALWHPPASR
jgi:protease-4